MGSDVLAALGQRNAIRVAGAHGAGPYMQDLEQFGVGVFTPQEIAVKTAYIKQVMAGRIVATHPYISVVVPAYKEEKYILATLLSLALQRYQNCEFIIVVNGEPEGNPTQCIVEACGFKVINDPRGGIARARQTGLQAAQGEVVVTTDADTVHHPQWLERISEIMSNPDIRCGAGLMRSLSRSFSVRAMQNLLAFTMRMKNSIHPFLVTGVSEANSFYRRDLAIAAEGYDQNIRVGEGMALFRKLRKSCAPLIYTDEELVIGTSGRRQEQQGALRWFVIGAWNTVLQLFGQKGIGYGAYPDIR